MALLAQLIDDVVTHRFEVTDEALTLGRHPANTVQINEEAVSGRHALIQMERHALFKDHRDYYLEDLSSTNGTFLNGKRIYVRVKLHHNDVIRLAWSQFKFLDEQEMSLERTVHMIQEM